MKLQDALARVTQVKQREGKPYTVCLACGFTPLHLATFIVAHLSTSMKDRPIECNTGLYGDLIVSLDSDYVSNASSVAVVVEWADMDPRLGMRRLGGWGAAALQDAAMEAKAKMKVLLGRVKHIAEKRRVAVSLPTLPLQVAFHTKRMQIGQLEWEFQRIVAELASDLVLIPGVSLVNPRYLDEVSPPATRHDIRGELSADFPFTLVHASALAGGISTLLSPGAAFKGIITDLDDTLWRGLVGEVGPDEVAWDLDHRAQIHGLFQQLLQTLAESGTLVAVASKNDPSVVDAALKRDDLLIRIDRMYPIEAGWGPKSTMVAKILATWNVGADNVVFIDDTEMELAEVASKFPAMTCLPFSPKDEVAAMDLFGKLRDMFGRSGISEEDRLRMRSIRQAGDALTSRAETNLTNDEFLEQADAELTIGFSKEPVDQRAVELINKTNQFNLNGKRVQESDWKNFLDEKNSFQMIISYRDKFGPLGKIAVIAGHKGSNCLQVSHWVMSCRAFSRHIEYRCLEVLYTHFAVDCIELIYHKTQRNQPLGSFLGTLLNEPDVCPVRIDRPAFIERCPILYQRILVNE